MVYEVHLNVSTIFFLKRKKLYLQNIQNYTFRFTESLERQKNPV